MNIANKFGQLSLDYCSIDNTEFNFFQKFENLEKLDCNFFECLNFLPFQSLSSLKKIKFLERNVKFGGS